MRYVLLINIDKTAPQQRAEMEAILHGHERFQAELEAAGKMIHTERLRWDGEAQPRQAQSRTAVRDDFGPPANDHRARSHSRTRSNGTTCDEIHLPWLHGPTKVGVDVRERGERLRG